MNEDTPIYNVPAILLRTSTGDELRADAVITGGYTAPREARWRVSAADGTTYDGPLFSLEHRDREVAKRVIADWWVARGDEQRSE